VSSDWIKALKHVPTAVGTEMRVFDCDTLTLRGDHEWVSDKAGDRVEIRMQAFELQGRHMKLESCMAALNHVIDEGVKKLTDANLVVSRVSGVLFIRRPFEIDGERASGRYGVVLKCE
jgi:hypothetical protein